MTKKPETVKEEDLIEKNGVMYKVYPRFEDPRGPFTGYAVDYHDNGQLKFKVKFKNGKEVERATEAKYLGCLLNDDNEARKELNKRIADTYATWKKLEPFWKHGNDE